MYVQYTVFFVGQEADARLHLAAVSLVLAVYVVADFIGGGAVTAVGKDLGAFAAVAVLGTGVLTGLLFFALVAST